METRRAMTKRTFWIGMLLVCLAVLVRLDFQQFGNDTTPARTPVMFVISYFVFSIILFSLSHFSVLQGRWLWSKIPVGENIAIQWIFYFAVYIGCTGFLVLFLPTAYSMGLLETIRIMIGWIVYAITAVFFALTSFFMTLISFLLLIINLFGETSTTELQPFQPPAVPEIVDPNTFSQPGALFAIIKSFLFWSVFIGIICLAIYQYLKQNRELFEAAGKLPFIRWILNIFAWLSTRFQQAGKSFHNVLRENFRKIRGDYRTQQSDIGRNYLGFRRLTPKQQVIFYYLALLKRGGESGVQREIAQTPNQYSKLLETRLPDQARSEIQNMTDAFLVARYSRQNVDSDLVTMVKNSWRRVRAFLHRRLSKRDNDDSSN